MGLGVHCFLHSGSCNGQRDPALHARKGDLFLYMIDDCCAPTRRCAGLADRLLGMTCFFNLAVLEDMPFRIGPQPGGGSVRYLSPQPRAACD